MSHLIPDLPAGARWYRKRCSECGATTEHWQVRDNRSDELRGVADRMADEVWEICGECGARTPLA